MMKNLFSAGVVPAVLALLCACAAPGRRTDGQALEPVPIPPVRFIVASDIHLQSARMGISGKAFEENTSGDRKLLAQSEEILDAALAMIRAERASFLIVCGDLTKDGERANHEAVAAKLEALAAVGMRVYVVPGNHDVANGSARSFAGGTSAPAESVSPEEFKRIHGKFGYGNAIDADADSLSYVAEPVRGLWLLALDSCLWRKNRPGKHPVTDGAFSRRTVEWIERTLNAAREQKKAVIAVMHHGVAEHYPGNKKYFDMYLVRNFDRIGEMLAGYGVRVVFTGHFHSQDITIRRYDSGRFIADVETGSFVTYPCPYRVVTVDRRQVMSIESRFISAIRSMPRGFREFARSHVLDSTARFARVMLAWYGVGKGDRELLAPQVARAYLAHIQGDEVKPDPAVNEEGISPGGKLALWVTRGAITGWYTDLFPADNTVRIDLVTGR
jgi:3',5'-cyclic AMP phosphodiesterase CpdA